MVSAGTRMRSSSHLWQSEFAAANVVAEALPSTSSAGTFPSRKKAKRSPAVPKVSAQARAKQFDDLYVDGDGDVLFCK